MPLLSREAINHPSIDRQNFSKHVATSRCDNVLLEYTLALELYERGLVKVIYPILVGDIVTAEAPGTQQQQPMYYYSNYWASGCHPICDDSIVVKSIGDKVAEHLERQHLGRPMLGDLSPKTVLDRITAKKDEAF